MRLETSKTIVDQKDVELYIADMLGELRKMSDMVGNKNVSNMLLIVETAILRSGKSS